MCVASWVRWWGRILCFSGLVSAGGALEDTWTGGYWDGLLALLSRSQVMVEPASLSISPSVAGASDFILQRGGGVDYLEGVKNELVVCPTVCLMLS